MKSTASSNKATLQMERFCRDHRRVLRNGLKVGLVMRGKILITDVYPGSFIRSALFVSRQRLVRTTCVSGWPSVSPVLAVSGLPHLQARRIGRFLHPAP